MSKCSEVWVFGEYISSGMEAEIRRAKWKNYCLRYFTKGTPEKTLDFSGRGEITECANFHNFVEVSEMEFISTSEEVTDNA